MLVPRSCDEFRWDYAEPSELMIANDGSVRIVTLLGVAAHGRGTRGGG